MSALAREVFRALETSSPRSQLDSRQFLRTFAISLAAWTVVGVVFVAQDVTRRLYWDDSLPWSQIGFWVIRVVLSAALTPVILWLGALLPIERHNWKRRAGVHVLLSLCFGAIRTGLEAAVYTPLSVGWGPGHEWAQPLSHTWTVLLIFGFHHAVIAYWSILSIQAVARYHEKFQEKEQTAMRLELNASELRAQVAKAQLGALKTQLQPHFLFNTLNAIMGMVRMQDVQQAEQALARLGDLLRAVLDDMDVQEVSLERELAYLQLYLSIEQMRFSDRLQVRIEADPDVMDAAVPHMVLQPIVENAVRHGIGCRVNGGCIEIRATRVDACLHLTVEDSGAGSRSDAPAGRGIGLSNLKARLAQLYDTQAGLRITCSDSGARVDVLLPFRRHVITTNLTVSMDGAL